MTTTQQPSGFERCLDSTLRCVSKVWAALEETQTHMKTNNMEIAYTSAFTAAEHSEKLTLLCRELPAYTGHPQAKPMFENTLLNFFPVEIGFTREGWFCLRIPALLPKKSKGSPTYISDPLYPAMNRFWKGKQPICYPDNVIVFRHVYADDRPERLYRDHDNIEVNKVVDVVSLYVMTDDSPMRCRHYYCSASGSSERTEVYVIPRREFGGFLEQEETIPKKGVLLYESIPKGRKKRM